MLKATGLGVLVLLAAAEAACPNQCSGHGYCDNSDRCKCFAQPGTKGSYRSLWTGADCSLRTCPYAPSHDYISDQTQTLQPVSALSGSPNSVVFFPGSASSQHRLVAFTNNGQLLGRDTGVDVRIVSVDTANSKLNFQYKLSFLPTYSAEVTASLSAYADRGRAYHLRPDVNGDNIADDSGIYVYFNVQASDFVSGSSQAVFVNDAYMFNVTHNEGSSFVASNANTAHAQVECAGRGFCDRKSGECKCVTGYTGDACQRTTCPLDCSNHGTCLALATFVEEGTDTANVYTATDAYAQYGCKCDAGFRGSDCSQIECPSGSDPLGGDGGASGRDCSSRGECDYTTGSCRCFKGFIGERCEVPAAFV